MKNYLVISLILLLTFQSYSQGLRINSELPVNIDANGSSPDQSAMLDVKSTNKGVLIPRMTTSQRNGINSPATGLLVFDTNTKGFWYYDGSAWKDISSSSASSEFPPNPQSGEMVYYNGTNWVSILPGTTGQKLCYCNGIPTWGPCPPTCFDNIQNQNETGIDCGGVCQDCPDTPCFCPNPVASISNNNPNVNCTTNANGLYTFNVTGTASGDIIQWSGNSNVNVQNGQTTTTMAAYIFDIDEYFEVYCTVTRQCDNGITYERKATYGSNISEQCQFQAQYSNQCGID